MARINAYVPDRLMADFREVEPHLHLSQVLQSAMQRLIDSRRPDRYIDAYMRVGRAGSIDQVVECE